MRIERTCAGCGETFTGDHTVRNGRPYCRDCKPPITGDKWKDHSGAAPETIAEYNASRASINLEEAIDR